MKTAKQTRALKTQAISLRVGPYAAKLVKEESARTKRSKSRVVQDCILFVLGPTGNGISPIERSMLAFVGDMIESGASDDAIKKAVSENFKRDSEGA